MSSSAFHQANAHSYEAVAGGTTARIAIHILTLLPPITATSRILDNACGPGIVTALIKASHPDAHIAAVDLTPAMIDVLKERIEKNHWSNVTTDLLDMRDLKTLQDNSFTHAITNFGIQAVPQDLQCPAKAARELYRVLKPGGYCTVSIWAERSFPEAFAQTARLVRPSEEPASDMALPEDWARGSWLMRTMEDAGFGNKVKVEPAMSWMVANTEAEMSDRLMSFKGMFLKGYSEEELAKAGDLLTRELRRMGCLEDGEGEVRMRMVAFVAVAWK